ncbi:hypothetical protein L5515_010483 [Caenorhabditis briggsae]|uniref:Uncharacterized protein n=1 Tax=Caenorhabditis briggsae TaxID=6238 RepID=A0AAE9ERY5_CAEBR|nr:hypothetical protein L5515_010483 [Caenorhabditis briggsae]
MWIDTKAKVGSTFQVRVIKEGSYQEFFEHFIDRIVSKDERRVRILTNNADIHILLEHGLDDSVAIYHVDEYFRLLVIPAEMKKSEYEDDCQEWICKIDPEIYVYDSESYFEESEADRYINELAFQEYLESRGYYDAEGI